MCPNGSICLKRKAKENTENDQGRELRVSGMNLGGGSFTYEVILISEEILLMR